MKKKWIYGKTVVLTGASSGIGQKLAETLIKKYNCFVIGIGRNQLKMEKTKSLLGDKQTNFTYQLFDVSNIKNWQEFYDYLVKNSIKVDVLINNAGFLLPFAKFEKYTEENIEEIINTNFLSAVYSVKIMLPMIKESPTPAIINVSSSAALCSIVGTSMYTASKCALKGFTECLAQDYKKQIYVGLVCPGFTKTSIFDRQNSDISNSKLINSVCSSLDKAVKKITKKIVKKRKRIVVGIDAKMMDIFYRAFPRTISSTVRKVLKASKQEIFNDIFK